MPRVQPGYVKRSERREVSMRPDELELIQRVAEMKSADVPATMRELALDRAREILRAVPRLDPRQLTFDDNTKPPVEKRAARRPTAKRRMQQG